MSYKTLIQSDAILQSLGLVVVSDAGVIHPEYGRVQISLADLRAGQTLNGAGFGLQGSRLQIIHTVTANAPILAAVLASDPVLSARCFCGSGAPSGSTLLAGNGMYCASLSGYIVAVSLLAAGTGYSVGDVLTVSGGTGTALQITVDAVDASGAITAYHVSRVGNYTAFPSNPVSLAGGVSFNLACQPADNYLDVSTPTVPVAYVCTTRGSNSTSVWAKIVGTTPLPIWI